MSSSGRLTLTFMAPCYSGSNAGSNLQIPAQHRSSFNAPPPSTSLLSLPAFPAWFSLLFRPSLPATPLGETALVFVVHGTQRFLECVGTPVAPPVDGTTLLGPWYATAARWRP